MRCVVVAALVACAGCSFEDVELDGKTCPCASGWECDPATLLCVPLVSRDAGFDAPAAAGDGSVPPDAPAPDARGTDAPSVDASEPDAGLDASAVDSGFDAGTLDDTACDDVHAGALLCDGFEEGSGFTMWEMPRGATYTTSEVYRGAYAIHAEAVQYLYANLGMITSGELHLRAYVYLPSGMAADHIVLLHAEQGGSPFDYVDFQVFDGAVRIRARNPTEGSEAVDGPPMPRDRWVCVEIGFPISPSATVDLRLDGVVVASLAHDTTRSTEWRTFYAGITYRGTEQIENVELYMDEVVVSRSPVGCD